MLQKTLALLHRSLRTDVRLLRVHFFRAGLLCYVLFALSEVQVVSFSGSPGLDLLRWLLYANFWFITLSGILYFSSAITEEKEEQTLGLLKLAGINPLSLLLGKWLPRMIGALLLIAVQLPFTLLSITLGGVLIHQVIAAYCTLAAHLVLCGSIGLFASVVSSRAGAAAVLTLLLMFGLTCLLPFLNLGVTFAYQAGLVPAGWIEPGDRAGYLLALGRLEEIMQTGFDGSAVGMQVVGNLA
ncbi:MAG: hypothetical protein JNG89_03050, partial [Planctomycetaceae bacterium]|nr:hypothetical protein [Planctomycetaceae bacterium]